MSRKRRKPSKPKKGDRVYYVDAPNWRGTIVRLEDMDDDGEWTAVVQFDSLATPDEAGVEVDGLALDEIESVSKLPIVERLAELGRNA